MQIDEIGLQDPNGRALSLVAVPRPNEFRADELPVSQHFMCFLAWDASTATIDEISDLANALLRSGAVSISCWGKGCERVHDIFDELIVGDGAAGSGYSKSIMTTWHSRESYREAIWYALFVAQPTDLFEATCLDSVFILVNEPDRIPGTREILHDPSNLP